MKIDLLPQYSDADRSAIKEWVAATLAAEGMAQGSTPVPACIAGQTVVYVDGRARHLQRGDFWVDDGASIIYIGYRDRGARSNNLPLLDRLAVVGAIISLAGLWEDFHETFMARAAAVLISSYEGVMGGLVRTEAAITALAFSADRSIVAGRIGDTYYLPGGEPIEVDDSWTIVPDRPSLHPIAS